VATSDVDVAASPAASDADSDGTLPNGRSRPLGSPWILVALTVAVAIPFVVALISLADPTGFPTLDLAHTSLRVRDVFSTDPPLVGLPWRIGSLGKQGSHPGPRSFWALAPFSKLFGGTTCSL
jgi:hypothetical protein